MSVIRLTHANGNTYAYTSVPQYVPGKGSRPIRKYLGKVDPETGSIIPSSGRRGRPRKQPAVTNVQNVDYKIMYEHCAAELKERNAEVFTLKRANADLASKLARADAEMKKLQQMLTRTCESINRYLSGN